MPLDFAESITLISFSDVSGSTTHDELSMFNVMFVYNQNLLTSLFVTYVQYVIKALFFAFYIILMIEAFYVIILTKNNM